MATARNVYPEPAVSYEVTITLTNGEVTVDNEAVLMQSTDTITFNNSASSDGAIQLIFALNPPSTVPPGTTPPPPGPVMFSSITLNPGQDSGPLTPQVPVLNPNGSVNYTIWSAGVDVGDVYAVQVGNGPLYVSAKSSATIVAFTPQEVRIPVGGTIEFYTVDGTDWDLDWQPANPFTQPAPLDEIFGLLDTRTKTYTDTGGQGVYTYAPGPNPGAMGGGGTVKTGNTN